MAATKVTIRVTPELKVGKTEMAELGCGEGEEVPMEGEAGGTTREEAGEEAAAAPGEDAVAEEGNLGILTSSFWPTAQWPGKPHR